MDCSRIKQVEKQAIEEGLDKIFEASGFRLREPGCSACLAMNDDKVPEGKYCVSTSNRNFEGRTRSKSSYIISKSFDCCSCCNSVEKLLISIKIYSKWIQSIN